MEIIILQTSSIYRDGGSMDKVVSNIGNFSYINELGNKENNNGFYQENKKVDNNTQNLLMNALLIFRNKEKQTVRKVNRIVKNQ